MANPLVYQRCTSWNFTSTSRHFGGSVGQKMAARLSQTAPRTGCTPQLTRVIQVQWLASEVRRRLIIYIICHIITSITWDAMNNQVWTSMTFCEHSNRFCWIWLFFFPNKSTSHNKILPVSSQVKIFRDEKTCFTIADWKHQGTTAHNGADEACQTPTGRSESWW